MSFNKKYVTEFSKLSLEQLYALYTDDEEKFNNTPSTFINDENISNFLSDETLSCISGGKFLDKNSAKKGVAATLSLLSAFGVSPLPNTALDLSPHSHALSLPFVFIKDSSIKDPTEIEELIEHIRTDTFYKSQLYNYMQGENSKLESKTEFAKWWKTNNNGKKWWNTPIDKNGGNISCDHTNNTQKSAFSRYYKIMDENEGKSEKEIMEMQKKLFAERSAATDLLKHYIKIVAENNGITKININKKTNSLLKSEKLQEIVNNYFGKFTATEQPGIIDSLKGKEAQEVNYRAFDYFLYLLANRQTPEQKWSNRMYLHNVKLAAPWAASATLGLILLLSASQVRSLLSSAGSAVHGVAIKAYNRFVYNRLKMEKDPVKLKELMGEYLKSSVFRQDAAMDRITEIMSGMADLWASSDATGIPCTSACTMTFMGDSGIGKTYAARMLSKALFQKDMQPWQFITSTSVTGGSVSSTGRKSGGLFRSKKQAPVEEKLSPADQLFNENSELIRQLKLNNRVIIVLDEIDKMHKSDPDDTILERLRDARDTGKLLVRKGVNYDYVDVSRTVFICITNEKRECWGLPPEELTPAQSAARTTLERDKSLVNRFDVVEFKYFTSEDYEFILRPELEELKEEYAQKYNINFEINKELTKSISDAAEIKNKGVRGVNDYMVLLRGKLVNYRLQNKDSLENEIHNVSIEFSSKDSNFNIQKIEESKEN